METTKITVRQHQENKTLPIFNILLFLTVVFTGVRALYRDQAVFRYAIYTLPLLSAVFYFTRSQIHLQFNYSENLLRSYLVPLLSLKSVALLISFFVLTFTGQIFNRFYEEAYFLISPLILALFLYTFSPPDVGQSKSIPRSVFLGLMLAYLIQIEFRLMQAFQSVVSGILTGSSQAVGESSFAFIFGLFLLFFVIRRDYFFVFIATLAVLVSFKRIVIYAALACIVLYLVLKLLPLVWYGLKRISPIVAVIVNIGIVVFIVNFAIGAFDNVIEESTGQNANEFTLGRRELQETVIEHYNVSVKDTSFLFSFNGYGATSDFILSNQFTLTNLHSDLLKLFIEFGPIFFCIFIFIFYSLNIKTLGTLILTVFINIIWISDNTQIYFHVWFTYYFLAILLLATKDNDIITATKQK